MKVAKEGIPFIAGSVILTVVLFWMTGWFLGVVAGFLALFVIFFFRNPHRIIPDEPSWVLAPADGKVIAIEEVDEKNLLNEKRRRISIFMSPLNVHVNRIPITGKIRKVQYSPGKYLMAFHEKSSEANERNAVLLEGDNGASLLFVQIAGFIARRIVCYLKDGDRVKQGDLYGLIRFGSRMDVYLPKYSTLMIRLGDHVRGGETPLAKLLLGDSPSGGTVQ
ncbi:MAG: phosphatidylserine decarboxylase family protein [bacterium]|nr:phosphatidylserine decarboxylase family protein [bacterium]